MRLRCQTKWLWSIAISFAMTSLAFATETIPVELNPAVVRKVQQKVTRPFNSGDMPLMVEGIGDLLASNSPELIASINAHLKKHDFGSLGELAANVWVEAIEQGNGEHLPKLSLTMAARILPLIDQRITQQLDAQKRHPLMQQPIQTPADFEAFEDGLWDLHVFSKQLENLFLVAQSCEKLLRPFARRLNTVDQDNSSRKLDFDALAKRISEQHKHVQENDAEVRYYRLENAANELSSSKDFETRIRAAFALQYDALILSEFFKNNPQPKNSNLQGEDIREEVEQLVKDGRTSGQDVIRKATLLNAGLHWWVRGRYGAGPLRHGLLKAINAHTSAARQFPLYMPEKPTAIDPFSTSAQQKSPRYERRHHYIWAVEYNTVTLGSSKSRRVEREVLGKTKNLKFKPNTFY